MEYSSNPVPPGPTRLDEAALDPVSGGWECAKNVISSPGSSRPASAPRRALRRLAPFLALALLGASPSLRAATYPVSSAADSGTGTLRAAIDLANADAGSTIQIADGLGITLASALPTLTAATTLDGGTGATVTGGSLLAEIFALDAPTVTLRNLTFANAAAASVLSGDVALDNVSFDVATFTKQGSGTLTLTGANTFSGTLAINGGTVSANTAAALGGGAWSFDGGTLATTASLALTQNATLAAGGATLAPASGVFTLGGVLDGAGPLTKTGAGTLTLTGDSTYSGPTTVQSGTLIVDGSIASDVTVEAGATFGGDGLVNGDITLASGSTLVSVDCFDATTLTWNPGATLAFGASDILELTGSLSKGTAGTGDFTFQLAADDWQEGQTYTLITFDTTDFSASDFRLASSSSFGGTFDIADNTVQFTYTAVPEPTTAVLLLGAGLLVLAARRRRRNG